MKQLDLRIRWWSAVFALMLAIGSSHFAYAVNNIWQGPDLGDWNVDANWSIGFVPNFCCDEIATINNNTTAIVSAVVPNANAMLLGQAAADIGRVRIANSGSLTTLPFSGGANGALTIGQAGQGNLTIFGGGSLSGASLSLGGVAGSSLLLGDTSGLTATLSTTGAATLNRTTQVTGRFVNFSVGGNLTLGATSSLVGQINHTSLHSALKSAGTANVNGTFKVEFSGVTPTVGNTWDIIDAATINGNFSALDLSAAPALPAGQAYQLRRTAGGTNGQLLQLSVEQLLTLRVNRSTHDVWIRNTGTTPVTFDGYSILSSLGALTGTWNSLTDQNVSGWIEAPVPPGNTDLSELNTLGSLTLNGGQERPLGAPYIPVFPAFGVDTDHLVFEYSTPAPNARSVVGNVAYEGTRVNNDLIITVNETTGQVQLKNDSPYTIQIDGYSIYSDDGLLQQVNGDWFSLDDRGISGWEEALSSSTVVSELNPDVLLTLTPFTGYDLGELYETGMGPGDLRFEFAMVGDDLPTEGTVVYDSFSPVPPPGLPGDFNNDEVVDAADYVMWRKTINTPAKYDEWRENFGSTLGGSGGSQSGLGPVPEASTVTLVALAALLGTGVRRRRLRTKQHSASSQNGWGFLAAAIAMFAAFAVTTGSGLALAQDLYFENFDDTTLEADTTTQFATVAGGIASFNDVSDTTRGRFVVRRSFDNPVMTFSFETAAAVTVGTGGNELVFRAGIGTANNTLSSTEFIVEAVLFRSSSGGNQGPFQNNGNESMFLIANNQATPLNFTSPVDGSNVILNAFQYVPYIKDNNSGIFAQLKAIANFADPAPAGGDDNIIRFGIGSSSNAHQGTFAIDDVKVANGVSFGSPSCILGDVNCDDFVDVENDFEAIRLNFRRTVFSRDDGDLNSDNVVDFDDFVEWKSAFLGGGGSLAGLNLDFGDSSVPEPASVASAILVALTALCRRVPR